MTLRAFLIGLLLIPLQAFWIVHMELVRGGIWPTVLSLLFTTVFLLFVLGLANLPFRRWIPRVALRDEELLAVYILLATGASLSGCDVGQTLVHILGAPEHFATPENAWEERFGRYLPEPFMVRDEGALKDFYRGASTLYRPDHLGPWIRPTASWMLFVFMALLTMLCLNSVVRRQWVDSERLAFPIVQVPLAMTQTGTFWSQRGLWWGFALAAAIDLVNGLNALVPAVPRINCKQTYQLGSLFVSPPWNAIGWLPITLYPFAVGLGFLMPLEMSFSCWLGLLLWKAEKVVGRAFGYPSGAFNAPFSQEQVSGVWIAVILFAIWTGRREWRRIVSEAWSPDSRGPERAAGGPRRWLILGAAGFLGMVVFGHRAGMTWTFAGAYFGIYLGFSLALTRMRAEFGPPCHDLYAAGPDQILVTWLGVPALGPRNLAATAVFYWLSRESPRSHPMPHQLEGLYLGGGRLPNRRLWPAILLAGCLSGLATFWAVLHQAYARGSETGFHGPATWFATEGFRRLDSWLDKPPAPNVGGRIAMLIALFVSLAALCLRVRFPWFAFHPAGYAISSWWAIHLLWFPLLLAWSTKRLVIRYGGAKAYRRARPFFFGLVLGEFVVGSIFQILGLLFRFTAYAFWI